MAGGSGQQPSDQSPRKKRGSFLSRIVKKRPTTSQEDEAVSNSEEHKETAAEAAPQDPSTIDDLEDSHFSSGDEADSDQTSDDDDEANGGVSPRAIDRQEIEHTFAKPPRPLTIVLLVVGTYGDVAPFLAIAHLLKQDGHRVRLASHPEYRHLIVEENGLEFYPLGGDPRKLSALLVKTGGWLFPNAFSKADMEWLNMSFDSVGAIMRSSWPACVKPDPDDPQQRPFVAESIIANPVAYGHIHCAEKLGVPLQLFFLQPWTPTTKFPHPFSNLSYRLRDSQINKLSYFAVDGFFWAMGMKSHTDKFRQSLGLKQLPLSDFGLELTKFTPCAYLWSRHLVDRPPDWGPHIEVIGSVYTLADQSYKPPAHLSAFLDDDPSNSPVFIGFGSMVIDDEKVLSRLVSAIAQAAVLTETRVILQTNWAKIDPEKHGKLVTSSTGTPSSTKKTPYFFSGFGSSNVETEPDDEAAEKAGKMVFILKEKVPHDWLFRQCSAVIHHGGASTVAMGLRCGKPTMVCPFFGDQFFWAQAVYDAGVGVPSCQVRDLDEGVLSDRFNRFRSKELRDRTKRLSKLMQSEDGAREAVRVFYRQTNVFFDFHHQFDSDNEAAPQRMSREQRFQSWRERQEELIGESTDAAAEPAVDHAGASFASAFSHLASQFNTTKAAETGTPPPPPTSNVPHQTFAPAFLKDMQSEWTRLTTWTQNGEEGTAPTQEQSASSSVFPFMMNWPTSLSETPDGASALQELASAQEPRESNLPYLSFMTPQHTET